MAKASQERMQPLAAEALGTFFLVATVVGSGIMGEQLSNGNVAIALLANSLATGAILVILIATLGPVSGAHFNPAVTLAFLIRRELSPGEAGSYVGVQVAAGVLGTMAAHVMFGLDPVEFGTHVRTGPGQWLGEIIATFALVFTILACVRHRPEIIPYAVGLVITAGYWYTSSTSFANPAVTIARVFTDSFSSIRPADAAPFILLQLAAAAAAVLVERWMMGASGRR